MHRVTPRECSLAFLCVLAKYVTEYEGEVFGSIAAVTGDSVRATVCHQELERVTFCIGFCVTASASSSLRRPSFVPERCQG